MPCTKEDLWAYAVGLVPDAEQKEIFTVVLTENRFCIDKVWHPEQRENYEEAVAKWAKILSGVSA